MDTQWKWSRCWTAVGGPPPLIWQNFACPPRFEHLLHRFTFRLNKPQKCIVTCLMLYFNSFMLYFMLMLFYQWEQIVHIYCPLYLTNFPGVLLLRYCGFCFLLRLNILIYLLDCICFIWYLSIPQLTFQPYHSENIVFLVFTCERRDHRAGSQLKST